MRAPPAVCSWAGTASAKEAPRPDQSDCRLFHVFPVARPAWPARALLPKRGRKKKNRPRNVRRSCKRDTGTFPFAPRGPSLRFDRHAESTQRKQSAKTTNALAAGEGKETSMGSSAGTPTDLQPDFEPTSNDPQPPHYPGALARFYSHSLDQPCLVRGPSLAFVTSPPSRVAC